MSLNLTWSQDSSRYVVIYYVEVTANNINITNMTTSQHITLTLQIGVVYSFRVRGADTINRLGEWSDPFVYPSKSVTILISCFHLHNYNYVGAPPLVPNNLSTALINKEDNILTVNLTWSQKNNVYVMVYYVEVTATNINFTNTTTSQHITLTLQIGVEYSFRVRGADTINRLGQWSDTYTYPGIVISGYI